MNSYKELALYDLRSAKANFDYALWNKVGRECQQACEKYIKHYLQTNHLLAQDLEKTHNLKKLIRAVPDFDKDIYKDLSVVGDYYFETNYPGDNFLTLDEEMAGEAMEIANNLIKYIDSL
ncbi:MAG: HEPN domain-containing protein [Clostridiales bacterium]|jgi:HEPN domain-containing protein|nr:HEPN domain-containing protein [Clostridiales bacterium]